MAGGLTLIALVTVAGFLMWWTPGSDGRVKLRRGS